MDPLREMFRHHIWATLTLIDHCLGLPPEALEKAVPGTYGPVLNTLVHLVGADQRYLNRLTGESPQAPLLQGELLPLADLRQRFEVQAHRWEALLDRIAEAEVEVIIPGGKTGRRRRMRRIWCWCKPFITATITGRRSARR